MAKKFIEGTELVRAGFANGISTQLAEKQKIEGPEARLTDHEKEVIIERAAQAYADFLTALGCDYKADPNSADSHHHQAIRGTVSIAYIASEDGKVVGLSKLNRIVEQFGRRGAIQEQLTVAIHNAVDKICEGNLGVAVQVNATHACVSCRGVKHGGASMQTAKLTGAFLNEASAKAEFYKNIELAEGCKH